MAEDDAIRIRTLYAERGMRKRQVQFYKRAYTIINYLRNDRDESYLTLFKQWLELNEHFIQLNDDRIYKIKLDAAVENALSISIIYAKCNMQEFQLRFCQHAFATINALRNVHNSTYLALFEQWLELHKKFAELCWK